MKVQYAASSESIRKKSATAYRKERKKEIEEFRKPRVVPEADSSVCYRFLRPQLRSKTFELFNQTYRRIAIPALDRMVKSHPGEGKVIVLDTETTGLFPGYDEIISLAIVDASNAKIIFDELLRPVHHRSWPRASEINRIWYRHVKDKPSFEERKSAIQSIISDAEIIMAFNVRFDLSMLVCSGIELPSNLIVSDVMLDYAMFNGESVGKCRSYKRIPLEKAAMDCCFHQHHPHKASSDCLATLSVYQYMTEALKHATVDIEVEPKIDLANRSRRKRARREDDGKKDMNMEKIEKETEALRPYHNRFSRMEKALVYYVRKMIGCIDEYEPVGTPMVCIDCFIPELRIAIEYDGRAFHQSGIKTLWEESTNIWCSVCEVRLIRIRDISCPSIDAPSAWMTIPYDSDRYPESAESAFNKVLKIIAEEVGCEAPDVDVRRDYDAITMICEEAKARWDEREARKREFLMKTNNRD